MVVKVKMSAPIISLADFFEKIKNQDKTQYKKFMQFLMLTYGTSLPCNRFAFGNCNEYAIRDLIKETGYSVKVLQNATRIDIEVENFGKFSIKYSGSGDIKLHNSNNQANHDMSMCDTLLVTPTVWWFLRPSEIEAQGIILKDYLKDTGDGLSLKATILTALKNKHYPYMFNFDISVNKSNCQHKEINEIIYNYIKEQITPTSP